MLYEYSYKCHWFGTGADWYDISYRANVFEKGPLGLDIFLSTYFGSLSYFSEIYVR